MKRFALALLFMLALVSSPQAAAQRYEANFDTAHFTNVAHYQFWCDDVAYPGNMLDQPGDLFYYRVGDSVTVYGLLDIQATTANVVTKLYLELPYPTTFTHYMQAAGSGTNKGGMREVAIMATDTRNGDPDNNHVLLQFIPTTTDLRGYQILFTYSVQ